MKKLASALALWCVAMVAMASPVTTDLDGNETTLQDHISKDQWTLVMIWATTCHICQHETPTINAYHEKHSADRLKVVGVALDGMAAKPSIEAFRLERDMGFDTLVVDAERFFPRYQLTTGRSFVGTPTFMLYDRSGKLVGLHVGALDTESLDQYIAANGG